MIIINLEKYLNHGYLPVDEKLNILVADDHQLILTGTVKVLSLNYPGANILTAQTGEEILFKLQSPHKFQLIVIDLSIPCDSSETAEISTGINLLKTLLEKYPQQNFMVQTSYVRALIKIRHEIDNHQGGFAIADKRLSEEKMLMRANLALHGATYTKDIKTEIEWKPEWLDVLRLAFEESLTDRAIAERMSIAERTVRTYWTKIQDVLGVYPEDCRLDGKNVRIQTEIRSREEGLID
ncbi:MAG: response regulator transcription factor [Scytonematopsis contorta HA4267-MV1]|nr:response regulator transcription factor [Scytonematopsis contorta HA4267-MV1]